MNTEDFENQLRRVPMREIPAEWRGEMLGEGMRAEDGGRKVGNARSMWRDLLWPCPQAWGALACIWLVIVVMATMDEHGSRSQQAEGTPPVKPDTMMMRLALERSLAGNKGLF